MSCHAWRGGTEVVVVFKVTKNIFGRRLDCRASPQRRNLRAKEAWYACPLSIQYLFHALPFYGAVNHRCCLLTSALLNTAALSTHCSNKFLARGFSTRAPPA